MSEHVATARAQDFLETQEYRRFAEFCDACRRYRYIGLCHGPPGVGKTLSARHYTRWDQLDPVLKAQRTSLAAPMVPELAECRTLFYTPSVTITPRRLAEDLQGLRWDLKLAVARALDPDEEEGIHAVGSLPERTELVLVDEADRLKFPSLEQLRDLYDRIGFGLILIGMPGLERRLARYAQLYSRVGFVHQFRPLSPDAMRLILAYKWEQLGLTLVPDDFTTAEAMAAIIRVTGGNFRLVQRLFSQIERVLQINRLQAITPEVVEAARQGLVIGPA
jgi:DNA transposition AAA+ family ATPase